jgi:hypothetical protein
MINMSSSSSESQPPMKKLKSSNFELEIQGASELERCLNEDHEDDIYDSSNNENNNDDVVLDVDPSVTTSKFPSKPPSKLNDEAWVLMQSQSGGHKCYSMGFAYTIDKPKQSEVETATKIYWRCEKYRYLKCTGRAVSAGLKPPLKITIGHNHPIEPERKEFRQYRLQMKTNSSHNNPNSADLNVSHHDSRQVNVNANMIENEYDLSEQQHNEQHENNLDYFPQDEFFTGKLIC